jgi:hypothetical protein
MKSEHHAKNTVTFKLSQPLLSYFFFDRFTIAQDLVNFRSPRQTECRLFKVF